MKVYFVDNKSFLTSWQSLQIGFPLYFGLPSLIFNFPSTFLQIQHNTIIFQNWFRIKIYDYCFLAAQKLENNIIFIILLYGSSK